MILHIDGFLILLSCSGCQITLHSLKTEEESNVSRDSRYESIEAVERSMMQYMEELDSELSALPGYKEPVNEKIVKTCLKSRTDSECGYIHQKRKKGLRYLPEMTIDTQHGIITGVDCYPGG